eukprot:CAMPEP_0194208018 /NCGR_PEP_ID=MMETSP0156-20130528/6598_1 /TAXON_ID=33649 /ORGANISM="Thalassionema nitzschioides, Strain L26-B" /LENGTH=762 /DNA_ID=CAMNT_0038934903 /DNA_START=151 /DNA_END=2436 /DNA_ORIENTATION=+
MGGVTKLLACLYSLNLAASFTPTKCHVFQSSASQLFLEAGNQAAADLIAQAKKLRSEVSQMDESLTLQKIDSIESRLNNKQWVEKHQEEEEELTRQLDELNKKMKIIQYGEPTPKDEMENTQKGGEPAPKDLATITAAKDSLSTEQNDIETATSDFVAFTSNFDEIKKIRLERNPIRGWPERELELYIPVAKRIEATMPDAPFEERIDQFRTAPELEGLRKEKTEEMNSPLKQVEQLRALYDQYFKSSSSVEKDTLKRQIDQLEKTDLFTVNSFDMKTKPMSEEELELRYKGLSQLPKVLQEQFLYRNNVLDDKMDLKKGIMLEHWDDQLQLLDQIRYIDDLPEMDFKDAVQGFESLPNELKLEFTRTLNLSPESSSSQVITALNKDGTVKTIQVLDEGDTYGTQVGTIEYIDRSRHVEELLPSLALLDRVCPDSKEIDFFAKEIIDSKTYALRSKPERVIGGYYVRGFNALQGEDANTRMLDILNDRISQSKLSGRIQLFFINDPTTLTDEAVDMEEIEEPLIFVAGIQPPLMYRKTKFLTRAAVSALGAFSLFTFAFNACEMNDVTFSKIEEAFKTDNMEQYFQLTSNAVPIGLSLIATQLAHEAGHRFVAWSNKFEIGPPNLIPSVQLGITGGITPLASPPKNLSSLFDFALAGPLAGFAVSLALLVFGLQEMIPMDLAQQIQLPALPINLLRSSALGGSLVEYFLGKGVLGNGSALPMHPFAITGFLGLIINSLALLPLGHTDGGRISLAMFGRRVAW